MSYDSYLSSVEVAEAAVWSLLDPIVRRRYADAHDHKLRATLPGKHDEWRFAETGLGADVDPNRRAIDNPTYEGVPLTTERLAAHPDWFVGVGERLGSVWRATFDASDRYYRSDGPPTDPEQVDALLASLPDELDLLAADPTLADFLAAIETEHALVAARFLDVDPTELHDPSSDHELAQLFVHGDVKIVYEDRELALVKPTINHDVLLEVLNQRLRGRRARFTSEPPEPAYVVGVDDTPIGLFAHMVDGTNLSRGQDVSADQIRHVMGFDTDYAGEPLVPVDDGRVRLQGDLAVERIADWTTADGDVGRCNLPIDNHLVLLGNAEVVGEADTEPVIVRLPDRTPVNVVHDEHENVAAELPRGEYQFYLLERGLRPVTERPTWPEPQAEPF